MGPGVGDAPEIGRSATRAYLGLIGELPRANSRAYLCSLGRRPSGCARSPTRPNPPNDETWRLPRRAVALGAHGQRACRLLVYVETRLCSPRHAGGCYERHEGTTSAGNDGWGLSCASKAAKATRSDFSGHRALAYLGVAWRAEHRGKPAEAAATRNPPPTPVPYKDRAHARSFAPKVPSERPQTTHGEKT